MAAQVILARVPLRRLARLLADQRGQAMVEYSTITVGLLAVAGLVGFNVHFSEFGGQSLVGLLYQSLQVYVDSVNYALSLALT